MAARCANPACQAIRHEDEGKLFRIEVELGDKAGTRKLKTGSLWLCRRCVRKMNPKIEVAGNIVRVLLAAIPAVPAPVARVFRTPVN
jgi:hypothetical protein